VRGRILPRRPDQAVQLRQRRIEEGYAEVEKCKVAGRGELCVTDAEIERAERLERFGASPADRLQELKRAHDQGLITDQEYETKRRQIVDGM
jgi:hypothetical protein